MQSITVMMESRANPSGSSSRICQEMGAGNADPDVSIIIRSGAYFSV